MEQWLHEPLSGIGIVVNTKQEEAHMLMVVSGWKMTQRHGQVDGTMKWQHDEAGGRSVAHTTFAHLGEIQHIPDLSYSHNITARVDKHAQNQVNFSQQ